MNMRDETNNVPSAVTNMWAAVRHNAAFITAVVVTVVLTYFVVGCESRVASLTDPSTRVTREELNVEFDLFLAELQQTADATAKKYDLKQADLDKQDAFKKTLLEMGKVVAETGTLNPTGIMGLLAGVLGVGAMVDNRRKDTIIKVQKRDLAMVAASQTGTLIA